MSGILENLQKVQVIDDRKDALQQRILKRSREKDALCEEKQRLEREFQDLKQALEKARLALARKELDLKEAEEKWTATRNKLYSGEITSSKELAQWEKSMKKLEEIKSQLEDEILTEMENVENLQSELQRKGHEVAEKGALLAQQIAAKEDEIANLEKELATLEREWQEIAHSIPPETLAYYVELRKKFRDAVVPLVGEICQGCHLSVPTIVAKAVRKKEGLVRCPNCGRFLY
ncbi:MAG: C4-type zinc ribbon domain-containing protein [Candidatus Caldatribacterium sp.]|uniref:zinc ribbon domain-containing protein n=1 Tax=Candidatus Caldatribacterium sp. TaxID=2282143 RepID=UPI00299B84C3|nr:C4-type zinc ribbon domain-containing protein [Candidatus Caldatribacterium sp.]MCX7731458.1 C4-type zinc ribbon domain-containing protein [Candidatus Caldatribacterium sp.]MDW8080624.1 C4-type zinc ribbon domain-containing protein [Candidatus Calescibacterium sp.]